MRRRDLQSQEAQKGKIRKMRWASLTAATTLSQHSPNLRGRLHLSICCRISANEITLSFFAWFNSRQFHKMGLFHVLCFLKSVQCTQWWPHPRWAMLNRKTSPFSVFWETLGQRESVVILILNMSTSSPGHTNQRDAWGPGDGQCCQPCSTPASFLSKRLAPSLCSRCWALRRSVTWSQIPHQLKFCYLFQ